MRLQALDPEDMAWALDHSRRRYLVRPSRVDDYPLPWRPAGWITVVRLCDGGKAVMLPECMVSAGPWENTDEYAAMRMEAINRSRALRGVRGTA